MDAVSTNKYYSRWGMLKTERSSWIPHYQEISAYLLPRNGRFFVQDRNKGGKRHNNIYDNTGTRGLRTCAAGMQSNMASPARPWFRLSTSIPELDQAYNVKVWLEDCASIVRTIFNRSNIYRVLHSMYEELVAFGTSAAIVVPDYENIIHAHFLTTGEYCIATNHLGVVDTLYREVQMTVGQMVKQFGKDKVSQNVKNLFDRGQLDQWVTVVHAIEPREDRDASKRDSLNMPWRSIYFEVGRSDDDLLSESGFKRFPAIAARWQVQGGDIYGSSPGMEVLGDIKQLQHEQMRKAQGIDYMTLPPIQVPASMKGRDVDKLPGGINYVDMSNAGNSMKTAWDARIDLSAITMDIQDVRNRISRGFYEDLFLMMANDSRSGITATEVAERHEEKMLMLGPVVERLHSEMLEPLIDLTFDYAMEAGILPPPPEELQGMHIDVEFVSVLAQAQRAVATNSIDRFVGSVGAIAQFKPEVLDRVDVDHWADTYSDMLGVDPRLLIPKDQADALRQQRAQAQAQAAQNAQLEQAANAASKLGAVQTQGGQSNAAADIMQNLTGYTTA